MILNSVNVHGNRSWQADFTVRGSSTDDSREDVMKKQRGMRRALNNPVDIPLDSA